MERRKQHGPPRRRGLSSTVLALLPLAGPASVHAGDGGTEASLERGAAATLQRIVASVPEGTSARDLGPWARQVAALGEEVVPEIFQRLKAMGPAEADDPGADLSLLQQGLELLGPRQALPPLRALLPPEGELDPVDAAAALRILSWIGRSVDLEWAVDLALRPGHPARLEEAQGLLLERTAAGILLRDPQATDPLVRVALRQGPAVVQPLALALVGQGSARALDALVSLVEHGAGELAVIPLVAGLADQRPWLVTEEHRGTLRQGLWSDDPQILRESIQAAARLDDEDALPRLLELAREGGTGSAESAHLALQALTAQPFPPVPARWQVWSQEEERWWSAEAPRLLADLQDVRVARVLLALEGLAGRALHRHAIASRVAQLLQHPERGVRARACEVLATLRSATPVHALVLALGDGDPLVVEAATQALATLTGLSPGEGQEAWASALR